MAARVENGVGWQYRGQLETDFVAKSDPFIAFGQNVLEAAIAADASTWRLQAASYEGKTVESDHRRWCTARREDRCPPRCTR